MVLTVRYDQLPPIRGVHGHVTAWTQAECLVQVAVKAHLTTDGHHRYWLTDGTYQESWIHAGDCAGLRPDTSLPGESNSTAGEA